MAQRERFLSRERFIAKRTSALVIAAIALVAVLVGQQSSVMASPTFAICETAVLQRDVALSPTAPVGSNAYVTRDIYLASGTYYWNISSRRIGQTAADVLINRAITLAAGNYRWYLAYTKWDSSTGYRVFSSLQTGNQPAAEMAGFFSTGNNGLFHMESDLTKYC